MITRVLPKDKFDAAINSTNASESNPFATKTDIIGYNTIRVETTGGDFTSVAAALASIITTGPSDRYIIKVGVGEFEEPLIDLSLKPYVSVIGSSINTTVIKALTNTQHIFKVGELSEISFLTIQGVNGANYAGIFAEDGGDFSQLHKVSIYDCDICVYVKNTNIESKMYLEYVDFGGAFSYGIKIESTGVAINHLNAENQYGFPTTGLIAMYDISGDSSRFSLISSGNEPSVQSGIGLNVYSGANVECFATDLHNFITAISLPNVGNAPTLFITGSVTENCVTDISVLHPSSKGAFQGLMNNPNVSVVSTSSFSVSYLEALLGNKKILYYDPYAISPVSVTSPTAAACSTVNQSSVTGLIALRFSGTADQNASMNFRIPDDYLRNGRFKISWSTSSTSANTVYFAPILTVVSLGGSLVSQTETLTPQTIAAGTINLRQETGYFIPTVSFSKGQLGVLRLTRLATNANDTFTGTVFINGVIFEYESSN